MATIEQRLAKLEAAVRARCPGDDRQQVAMSRLLATLREALPDDEYEFGLIYPPGWKSHMDKLRDLSGRIDAGTDAEEDRALLDALPQDALDCLDMAAPELVTMLVRVEAMC